MARHSGRDRLAVALGDLVFRLLAATTRRRYHGDAAVRDAIARQGGAIYALWHGRLLLGALAHRPRPTAALISRHADGEIIARIVARHGVTAARGSSTRGGVEGFEEMVRLARAGFRELAVTPDGPKGPRHRARAGAVRLAAVTGYALVPSSVSVRPGRFFRSWDRFLLPFPLSRLEVVYGEPMTIPPDADAAALESWRERLEAAMTSVEAEADRRAGWTA